MTKPKTTSHASATAAEPAKNNTTNPQSAPEPAGFDAEKLAFRARAELGDAIEKMDNCQACLVWALWRAIEHEQGTATPAETFISDVATSYIYSLVKPNRGMTPEQAEGHLWEFRISFREVTELHRRFNDRYANASTVDREAVAF